MSPIEKFWAKPSARFVVCGGIAALVNWAARFPLSLVMPFSAAVLAALAIGMCVGFLLYRTMVWSRSDRPLLAQISAFITVNSINAVGVLAVSMLIVAVLGHTAINRHLAEALGHGVGIAAGAVANFIGHSRFTFGRKPLTKYG